jgi:hypothetical protein
LNAGGRASASDAVDAETLDEQTVQGAGRNLRDPAPASTQQ